MFGIFLWYLGHLGAKQTHKKIYVHSILPILDCSKICIDFSWFLTSTSGAFTTQGSKSRPLNRRDAKVQSEAGWVVTISSMPNPIVLAVSGALRMLCKGSKMIEDGRRWSKTTEDDRSSEMLKTTYLWQTKHERPHLLQMIITYHYSHSRLENSGVQIKRTPRCKSKGLP